jgi:23S rRNA (pseudouridine1915-N3)-methyltransferase
LLEAARDFEARIRRYADFEPVELKEEPLKRGAAPDAVRRAEGERIRAARQRGGRLVAFEIRGRSLASTDWARRLESWRMEGGRGVDLVIGGPVGIDPDLTADADEVWSLGPLTLPHRLARVVVLEQLYRAFTILNREPYHK